MRRNVGYDLPMTKPRKIRIPPAWHDMRPGDINPQRVSADRLEQLITAAAERGLSFQRAIEFDHDTALYVRLLLIHGAPR